MKTISERKKRKAEMLTKRMLELYRHIEDYKARNGVVPSYDEMANMMGISSKSAIHRLITAMEQRGAIRRMPNLARAIWLNPLD